MSPARRKRKRIAIAPLLALAACAQQAIAWDWNGGVLAPGEGMAASDTTAAGKRWSVVVDPVDITIEYDGRTVLLSGFGSQQVLRWEIIEDDPPGYVFVRRDRPRLTWRDDLIQIGERRFELDREGSYTFDRSGQIDFTPP